MITIKTLSKVKKEHPGFETLIREFYQVIGQDSIHELYHHGTSRGLDVRMTDKQAYKIAIQFRMVIQRLLSGDIKADYFDILHKRLQLMHVFVQDEITKEEREHIKSYAIGGQSSVGRITSAIAWYTFAIVCSWFIEESGNE